MDGATVILLYKAIATVLIGLAVAAVPAAIMWLGKPGARRSRSSWVYFCLSLLVSVCATVLAFAIAANRGLTSGWVYECLWAAGIITVIVLLCHMRRLRAMILLDGNGWTAKQLLRVVGYVIHYYGEHEMLLNITFGVSGIVQLTVEQNGRVQSQGWWAVLEFDRPLSFIEAIVRQYVNSSGLSDESYQAIRTVILKCNARKAYGYELTNKRDAKKQSDDEDTP